jgi:hypothetical protein
VRSNWETAMKPFDLKIVPVLTQGLGLQWEHSGEKNRKRFKV